MVYLFLSLSSLVLGIAHGFCQTFHPINVPLASRSIYFNSRFKYQGHSTDEYPFFDPMAYDSIASGRYMNVFINEAQKKPI